MEVCGPITVSELAETLVLLQSEIDAALLALEAEGFRVDVKAVPDDKEFPFSLHATKNMRVHALEMKEYTRRFKLLATAHAGRYDGWGST